MSTIEDQSELLPLSSAFWSWLQKWEGRGQGTLTLRRPKAESSGGQPADPFAVFTTEAGRILVNGRLHHGQAPTKVRACWTR